MGNHEGVFVVIVKVLAALALTFGAENFCRRTLYRP